MQETYGPLIEIPSSLAPRIERPIVKAPPIYRKFDETVYNLSSPARKRAADRSETQSLSQTMDHAPSVNTTTLDENSPPAASPPASEPAPPSSAATVPPEAPKVEAAPSSAMPQ